MTDQEILDYFRWWAGNVSESTISDEDLQKILDMTRNQYPNVDSCTTLYRFIVNVLLWLIREASKGSTSSTVAGAVTKIYEQRGGTTKYEEYSDGGDTVTSASWSTMLEDLEDNPSSIGCSPTLSSSDGSTGSVIIGVSKDRFDTSTPWRQNQLTPKRKSWYGAK